MSGYCQDCGNTQCLCDEIAADEAGRKAHSLQRHCYAALVKHWRDCAKGIADNYWKLRQVAPAAAERAKARSETYADCAHQLEEAMRHNAPN